MAHDMDIDVAVADRYGAAANEVEAALCCPVEYDPRYLEILPEEILDRDYGCGDPSAFVSEGDSVLDLGSGGGKICYIASQIVGERGRVIGVDTNTEMLSLARKYRSQLAEKIGYQNVEFRYGRIQDLRTDLESVQQRLREKPIGSIESLRDHEAFVAAQKIEKPLVGDSSIDVVLSNCVLNLVRPEDKDTMFKEMFRVLKRGGKAAISDIVSDEDVPKHLQDDPELWSGCISGAYREDRFIEAFERAGFYGMELVKRDEKPWQTVEGIEFRSITVVAYKGKQGPCLERNQAVIYKGPWKRVVDDDGHVLERGQRMAVCDKTFNIYSSQPYAEQIEKVDPFEEILLEDAVEFDCKRTARRHPRETKGMDYDLTEINDETCGPDGDCC